MAGGAGGYKDTNSRTVRSGSGGRGTSYSGGAGGGGAKGYTNNVPNTYAGAGSDTGGAGGYGVVSAMPGTGDVGGGTGNKGGDGASKTSSQSPWVISGGDSSKAGNNGTGGLLIIYCDKYANKGTIEANGVATRNVGAVSGGASGGGSVNIFYNEFIEDSNKTYANGGSGANYGGAGGNGTVTKGSIATGTFII